MIHDKSMTQRLLDNSERRRIEVKVEPPDHMILMLRDDWERIKSKFQDARARLRYRLLQLSGAIPRPSKDAS